MTRCVLTDAWHSLTVLWQFRNSRASKFWKSDTTPGQSQWSKKWEFQGYGVKGVLIAAKLKNLSKRLILFGSLRMKWGMWPSAALRTSEPCSVPETQDEPKSLHSYQSTLKHSHCALGSSQSSQQQYPMHQSDKHIPTFQPANVKFNYQTCSVLWCSFVLLSITGVAFMLEQV